MPTTRRYRCRLCGLMLPAWLPVTREPDGAMLGLQALAPVNLLLAGFHKKHCDGLKSVL